MGKLYKKRSPPAIKPRGINRAFFVQLSDFFEKSILFSIDDAFGLSDGEVEFFRQLFKTQTIDESSLQDSPVAFVMDVFVD